MKKKVLFCLLSACLWVGAVEAQVVVPRDSVDIPIRIGSGPGNEIPHDPPGHGPRTPVQVPVQAYLFSDGALSIDATALDIDFLNVRVVDEEGENVFTNSYPCASIISVDLSSLSEGDYTLILYSDELDHYFYGEFEIEP